MEIIVGQFDRRTVTEAARTQDVLTQNGEKYRKKSLIASKENSRRGHYGSASGFILSGRKSRAH